MPFRNSNLKTSEHWRKSLQLLDFAILVERTIWEIGVCPPEIKLVTNDDHYIINKYTTMTEKKSIPYNSISTYTKFNLVILEAMWVVIFFKRLVLNISIFSKNNFGKITFICCFQIYLCN